jgi:hypothetical protein
LDDEPAPARAPAREPTPHQVRSWENETRRGHKAAAVHFRALGYDVTPERVAELFRVRDQEPRSEADDGGEEDVDTPPHEPDEEDVEVLEDEQSPEQVRENLRRAITLRVRYLADAKSLRGKNQMFVANALKVLLDQRGELVDVTGGNEPTAATEAEETERVKRAMGIGERETGEE